MYTATSHPLPCLSFTTSLLVGAALPMAQMRKVGPGEVSDLLQVLTTQMHLGNEVLSQSLLTFSQSCFPIADSL
jgi:hypothetical protein